MSKVASVGRARSIEALVGAVLGAGAGAAIGRASYSPATPVEWTDDYSNEIMSRKLNPAERKDRSSRSSKFSAGGLGTGIAGSLALSGLLRGRASRADRAGLSKLIKKHVGPLEKHILNLERKTGQRGSQLPLAMDQMSNQNSAAMKKLRAATAIHNERMQGITNLVEKVKRTRAESPWGGWKLSSYMDAAGRKRSYPSPATTIEGAVVKDFYGNPRNWEQIQKAPGGLGSYYQRMINRRARGK